MYDEASMRKRFHQNRAEAKKIRDQTDPLRAERDKLLQEYEPRVRELEKKYREIEAPLFDLDREAAMLARALNGRTAIAPADSTDEAG